MQEFDYDEAFSRNIGWTTPDEQGRLRSATVAIGGLGGVGGSHLLTLARLGIGRFRLADFDRFELANFNRQAGATMSTLSRPKLDVAEELVRDINPEVELGLFPEGVTLDNLDRFLAGVDVFVDGLDFFQFEIRTRVFDACRIKGIPVVTAAPLGMGAALLVFSPDGMSFDEYFRLSDATDDTDRAVRFLLGLAPRMPHRDYLVWPQAVDLGEQRGPSSPIACQLCAGLASGAVLKLVLGRGPVAAVPWSVQVDAYKGRSYKSWCPGGNRNPLMGLKRAIIHRLLPEPRTRIAVDDFDDPIDFVLDAARWAPSGDNAQPWRFEKLDPRKARVRVTDTRSDCVYDLDGHATELGAGALLENCALAAAEIGFGLNWQLIAGGAEDSFDLSIELEPDEARVRSPLYPAIRDRAVCRFPLSTRSPSDDDRAALKSAVGPSFGLELRTSLSERWSVAKLTFHSAHLRLTIREAWEVHRSIIDWDAETSKMRIPDQALGADPLLRRLMRWGLARWERADFLNRYLAGTLMPRLELDLLPGMLCGAHVALIAESEPRTRIDYIEAGRAVQRLWLTAETRGLRLQPEMTPLIFARYARERRPFSAAAHASSAAAEVGSMLESRFGATETRRMMFLGRVGFGRARTARSLRRDLGDLLGKA